MTEKLLSGLRSIEVGDKIINTKPLQDAADLIEQLQEQLKDSQALNVQQHDQIIKLIAGFKPTKYFSNDNAGDGFQYHDTLEAAKNHAEGTLDRYRDKLADGDGHDIYSDGDFELVAYGIVIGSATYDVADVVTDEDHKNERWEHYEVGTEIISVSMEDHVLATTSSNAKLQPVEVPVDEWQALYKESDLAEVSL